MGNYKLAHSKLFDTHKELVAQGKRPPQARGAVAGRPCSLSSLSRANLWWWGGPWGVRHRGPSPGSVI